ncbi:MAG: diacylglycerol kinase family protein [Chlorobi bacterium]|nr:diacylglycerol kinase family protein [Chlorobiota bacterium]
MDEPRKKEFSFKNRLLSFRYAFKGIFYAVKTQHNLWIHLAVGLLVIFSGWFLRISLAEWLIVIICFALVISAEIINSAIELLTDIVSPEANAKAGLVKDMAAGAVLFSAICSAIAGLVIFVPKILQLL